MADTKSAEQFLENAVGQVTEQIKGLLTEREQADAETRASLQTKIDELNARLEEFERRQVAHRAASLPGVEYDKSGLKPGQAFSLARAVQIARAQAKGLKVDERVYGYELEVQRNMADQAIQRTMNVGTDGAGGVFVPHEVLVDSIVPPLTAQAVVRQAGARVIGGLRGDLSWPINEAGTATYYVDTEGEEEITESASTFGQLTARPRTLAAMTKMTHRMMTQPSLAIEGFIRDEFAREFAIRETRSALEGSGAAGVPQGLTTTDGVNKTFTIDVSPSSTVEVAGLTDFVYEPAIQNYTNPAGRWAWVMSPNVAKAISGCVDADGRRLFQDTNSPILTSLFNYPVFTTTAVNSGAGFLSYGDWSQLLILNWGGLTIRATEEGSDAKALRMSVIAYMDHDMLVVQPKAFCVETVGDGLTIAD